MRSIILAVLVLAACTKPNPNVCCTDEADCNAKGIPVGSQCGDGLLCRGNQCIAQPCGGSSECDSSAPYCVADACAEACTDDTQCPGFGQTDLRFCDDGACRQCRMNDDCAGTTPVCDGGTCRGCTSHDQCTTGICESDGACATSDKIAYVDAAGSASSDCSKTAPCTLSRALTITPIVPYVLIAPGAYLLPDVLLVGGAPRALIGSGSIRPQLTRTSQGPIITIDAAADVTFEHLEISGATGTSPEGNGIECGGDGPVGARVVHLVDMLLANNSAQNLYSKGCTVSAVRSEFRNAGRYGVYAQDTTGTFDRCSVHDNLAGGIMFDAGLYTLTNSFIYRNSGGGGINFYASTSGSRFEFNTIVDNSGGFGALECNGGSVPSTLPNNIIARNTPRNTYGNTCTFPSSLLVDSDISELHFKSPDAAPYDYRLTAGSIAIDAATLSTVDHDFDGEARPNGAGRDVGADEYVP
jgi:hypothetical protein